jgi:hypothetical protein
MATLLSYDISGQHVAFKKALIDLKYSDQISGNLGVSYLPNTTLIHSSRTPSQALQDAKNITAQLRVTLERCIAVSYDSTWQALYPGERHG